MQKHHLSSITYCLRLLSMIVGLVVAVDTSVLIAMGKIHFGTVMPLLLAVMLVGVAIYWQRLAVYRKGDGRIHHWVNRLWYVAWTVFLLWLGSLLLFFAILQQQITAHTNAVQQDLAAIIVLGSGTTDGKPTPTLAKRLDIAAKVYASYPNAMLIVSGGQGFGKRQSEADIMANYLTHAHGVPTAVIYQEGRSTSTEENLQFSQTILQQQGIGLDEPIAIVTSDFHTIRAAAIARHQGYQHPVTVASATPLSIRYNAWFREYFAFISGWLLGEY